MEQNNKLTPAFINEKDVCTDFMVHKEGDWILSDWYFAE